MANKLMWAVTIESFGTNIHGVIYASDEDDAVSHLREAALEDLEKVKEAEPWRDWSCILENEGRIGHIYSNNGNADDYYQEKFVCYKVCRKRVTV